MNLTRRTMFAGMAAAIAAPAIIRTPGLIMPIKVVERYGASATLRALLDMQELEYLRRKALQQMINPPIVVDGERITDYLIPDMSHWHRAST